MNVSWYASVLNEDNLWISSFRYNGLYKINLQKGDIHFVRMFQGYRGESNELHLFAKKFSDKIYFFPQHASAIDIYDCKLDCLSKIDCAAYAKNGFATMVGAYVKDNQIYVIPRNYGMPLLIISSQDDVIVRKVDLKRANKFISKQNFLTFYTCQMDDQIFFPIYDTNHIGIFNMDLMIEQIVTLPKINRIKGCIAAKGHRLWLNADSGVFCFDIDNNELLNVCNCEDVKEGWIEKIVFVDDLVICIPRWLGNIYVINSKTFENHSMKIDQNRLHVLYEFPYRDIMDCFVWKGKICISPMRYKEMIVIDLFKEEIEYKSYDIDLLYKQKDVCLIEKCSNDLASFMEMIK